MKTIFRGMLVSVGCALMAVGTVRADEALRRVQQSLRDQGFYFGAVDGSPGDETSQAVRRYQIRNGLTVSGELNNETRASIEKNGAEVPPVSSAGAGGRSASSRPSPTASPAYQRPTVRPVPDGNDEREAVPPTPVPRPRATSARPDLRVDPDVLPPRTVPDATGNVPGNAVLPSARLSALFEGTPYEFAPPPVQADVVRQAQLFLTRQGFFDGPANGALGGILPEALTNFQGYHRLRKTGRLDVSTLGTMRLLPGRQTVAPRDGDDDNEDNSGSSRRKPNIIFEGRIVR